jgi:hypothetical protein
MPDCLLDTNVLIYLVNTGAPEHATANGLGWTVEQTRSTVEMLRARFPILPEPPEVVGIWMEQVAAHDVKGNPTSR